MSLKNGYYVNFLDGTIYLTKEFYALTQDEDTLESCLWDEMMARYYDFKVKVI